MFHVGQRVICVASFKATRYGERVPIRGGIYTVRECKTFPLGDGVYLREIVNEARQYYSGFAECSFIITGFRPLDERATDITIFQEIASGVREPEREPEHTAAAVE